MPQRPSKPSTISAGKGSKNDAGTVKFLARPTGRRVRRALGTGRSSAAGTLRRQIRIDSPSDTRSTKADRWVFASLRLTFFMTIN